MPFDPNLVATQSTMIHASAERVWTVLTNPDLIQRYLFGARTRSDWRVGSPIVFEGEFQGAAWQDKGVIQEIAPPRVLRYTYWSGACGLEDRSQNYAMVTYRLEPAGSATRLIIEQQGYASAESRQNSEQGWASILSEIRRIAEEVDPASDNRKHATSPNSHTKT